MISPMPFCPSLPPWAKDTPVQVRISSPRIHHGGGSVLCGSSYSFLEWMKIFITHSSRPEKTKPISGLNSSASSTLTA